MTDTNIKIDEWLYVYCNPRTGMYEVIKERKGKGYVVLRSFKRKGNAHNYELSLMEDELSKAWESGKISNNITNNTPKS